MKRLVFDVGGTYIKYCLMDKDLSYTKVQQVPTPLGSLEEYLDVLEGIFRIHKNDIDGIAMSVPGLVDNQTGYITRGGCLLEVKEIPFTQVLSARCDGIPVAIENDAKAAGRAELVTGSLKDANNAVICVLGTAIGGCIVVNREILRGNNGFAGELSCLYTHDWSAPEKGPQCWCFVNGNKNLWDLFNAKTDERMDTIDGKTFFEYANQGDETALSALSTFCRNLCLPLANIQCVIDPDVIAIGGGISAQPLLIQMIRQEFEKFFEKDMASNAGMRKMPQIVSCKYRNDANLIGAYHNFDAVIYGK